MRKAILTIAVLALGVLNADRAAAHHAFAAEFDAKAPVLLRGKITKMEWVNPHTWVHLEVVAEDGQVTRWMVEGGTPNTLLRAGVDRNTLAPGTEIIVRGYQSKDRICEPACKANGRDITFTDGRKIFMGSSGTGAPRDGTDPGERGGADTELPEIE
ncbi:MAG: DUF6152 family protein [Alphaproteobacteria bacterium]|nr:DUF6152 family protein [Alphaproteobacteria bacterium]